MENLSDSVESIIDAILAAVQDAVDDSDGLLAAEGVKAVVRGDRARPMPKLPAVWVVPGVAVFTQKQYGPEDWAMPVSLAALVKSDDPATGGKAAQRIAALARAAALQARPSESSDMDVEVTDVVSQSFDPTARSSERNKTLFWTDATILVTFTVSG